MRVLEEINHQPKRGDIYWITPSPYTDGGEHTIRSNRPAIIVSADRINRLHYNYEVVFLTTKPKVDLPTYCTIRSAARPSTAICDQIQTVSCEQLREYVGTCTQEEMYTIDMCMLTSLGIEMDIPRAHSAPEPTPEPAPAQKQAEDTEVFNLRIQLARARHGEEIMKELYENLLQKSLGT